LDLQEVAVGFSLPQAATLLGEEEENPGMWTLWNLLRKQGCWQFCTVWGSGHPLWFDPLILPSCLASMQSVSLESVNLHWVQIRICMLITSIWPTEGYFAKAEILEACNLHLVSTIRFVVESGWIPVLPCFSG
jgi:hypothetical protein